MNRAYLKHFSRSKRVMGGQTVLKGTRVLLRTVLVNLAAGHSPEKILKAFPTLKPVHLQAAIAFAAASASEDIPLPAVAA